MPPTTPPDPALDAVEQNVLAYLMSGKSVSERTLSGITAGLGLEKQDVHRALRELERRRPQLARPDVDATLGSQFWMSTPDAAEAVD